ncbi:MAG: hypothetical protein OXK82_07550 [Deltaproteobacteria bacterium]|nr:hypothetical protein [Deltaproteobacteria bacterium]
MAAAGVIGKAGSGDLVQFGRSAFIRYPIGGYFKRGAGVCIVLAVMGALPMTPGHADTADDIDRAERELERQRVVRDIAARAHQRAREAAQQSSVGKQYHAKNAECGELSERAASARKHVYDRHGIPTGELGFPELSFVLSEEWMRRFAGDRSTGLEQARERYSEISGMADAASARAEERYKSCKEVSDALWIDLRALTDTLEDVFLDEEIKRNIDKFLTD